MINRINIKNFATIENAEFDLGPGFNVITGETGAGKSVLVEAISIALGGRADTSMVRTGTDKALIQIIGEMDGEEIIITREILPSGKSVSKLNDEIVTLQNLKKFCSGLVDIHGQYDNQKILDPSNYISMIDSFEQKDNEPLLEKLYNAYEDFRKTENAYKSLLKEEAEYSRQRDFFEFESSYISNLKLRSSEEEELKSELDIMKNSEIIFDSVTSAYNALHESEPSVLNSINKSVKDLSKASVYSTELSEISESLSDIYYNLDDISNSLRNISESLTFSEDDMDKISERLSTIEDAKRKYRLDVPGIIAYGEELQNKLSIIENFDSEKEIRKNAYDKAFAHLIDCAQEVSNLRHENATKLETAINKELLDLAFSNAEFKIEITRSKEITRDGFDEIEFLIKTNPGEPLRPIAKIVSGGEMSRVMLAFKHILGKNDNIETMIFDEIDTGISGKTALVVGKKMSEISTHHQLICITHLPQIAAYASDNYLITKSIIDNKSCTTIEHLDETGKLAMLANLISGNDSSGSALAAAKELIQNVQN